MLRLSIAAVGAALSVSSGAMGAFVLSNGQSVSLSDVINSSDHQVNIGDKVFTISFYTSNTFPASNIFLTAFVANNPNNGIGFDITGGFGDVVLNDGGASTFHLEYTVAVNQGSLNAGYRIKDTGFVFDGGANFGESYARVSESVSSGATNVATLNLAANAAGGSSLQAYRDFSPSTYASVSVVEDAQFFADGQFGSSSASFIRQSFSQIVVPAPTSLALLGCGGLVLARRRRSL